MQAPPESYIASVCADARSRGHSDEQPHEDPFDVVVAGGGIAGTMTAIAAASEGARTLLVERYAAVGGMATLGLVQPMTMWGIRNRYVVGGRGRKLLERLFELGVNAATPMSCYGPTCDAEYLKRWLEVSAIEAGAKLLYHTWVTGVEKKKDVLTGLRVVSKAGSPTLRTLRDKRIVGSSGFSECLAMSFLNRR